MSILDLIIDQTARRLYKAEPGSGFDIFEKPLGYTQRVGLADVQGDTTQMIKAFKSLVFSCIHVRATAMATAGQQGKFRLMIERGIDELVDAPLDHPLNQLLRRPNPYLTRWYLWYLTGTYLDLTGNSYWWKSSDRLGVPRELWPLPSDRVTIVPGDAQVGEGLIKEYVIDWGQGRKKSIPHEEIIHLRHPNPADPYYYGGSLVMKAATEVDIDQFISEHQRDFFKNAAIPAGVVTFPQELSRETRKAFEAFWKDKFTKQPGQTAILEGGGTYTPMVNQKELDYLQSVGMNRHKIQMVFGVPDSKLGLEENISARATLETLDYNFHKETIEPLLNMIDEQLTNDLAKQVFDEKLIIIHDSTIPKDLRLQAEVDEINLRSSKHSINELRERDGWEPVKGGDEPLAPFSSVPISQLGAEPKNGDGKGVGAIPAKNLYINRDLNTDDENIRALIWKIHERVRMTWERRLTRKLKKLFREIEQEVLKNVEEAGREESIETGHGTRGKQLSLDALLFDTDRWANTIAERMGPEAKMMIKQSFERFAQEHGLDNLIFAPTDPAVKGGVELLASKTRLVPSTLHDELQREVNAGLDAGESLDQLSSRIGRFFNRTIDYRSLRIARTNSNFALNRGAGIAAKQSGIFKLKIWVSQRDQFVRHTHAAIDGMKVAINEKFKLPDGDQLEEPSDPNGRPGNTVNCRCTAAFSKK